MNNYRVTQSTRAEQAARSTTVEKQRSNNCRGKNCRGGNRLASRRGSTLVEMALMLPLLLLLTMGIIQYGIIMNATNTLSQITREGARYAAINPGSGSTADNQKIKDYIEDVSTPTTIRWADIRNNIVITTPDGINKGNRISVTITYPMSRKVFMIGRIMGVRFFAETYTTASTFAIE